MNAEVCSFLLQSNCYHGCFFLLLWGLKLKSMRLHYCVVLCLLYSDQNYDPSLSVQASSFPIITLVKIIASRISKKKI